MIIPALRLIKSAIIVSWGFAVLCSGQVDIECGHPEWLENCTFLGKDEVTGACSFRCPLPETV